jgi:hypothetical protein
MDRRPTGMVDGGGRRQALATCGSNPTGRWCRSRKVSVVSNQRKARILSSKTGSGTDPLDGSLNL